MKLKVTAVQTATAKLADCDNVQIDVADTSRVIKAHFAALALMISNKECTIYDALGYLHDQLEKAQNNELAPDRRRKVGRIKY